tara:strand:- start:6671 stop:7177 length:507 start_codon:yes stop_codon:yes gene_type:complete
MRIFLFIILSLSIWGCTTVEVTKEVIKVTNTLTDKVKETVQKKEEEEEEVLDKVTEEKEIEQEIEIIEEKKEEEKNIVQSQQKLAEINFIGNNDREITNILGSPQLSRNDGSVLTLRYDSDNCRLFLFFKNDTNIKRVEYFELRNDRAELLNSKQSLEQCYREFKLIN